MKLQYTLFVFLISLYFISCDTEKKELKVQANKERAVQKMNYEKIVDQYSATFLDQAALVSKFSYELEEEYLHKNIACMAYIFDVKKTNRNQYVLFAKEDNLSLELRLNQSTLDKILKYRSELSKKEKGLFKWRGLSKTPMLFIIKPNDLSKQYDVYKTISDFDYIIETESNYEEGYSSTEVELIDYTVDLELTNDGFHIKADCIDLTLVNKIYWDLK